MIFFDFFIEMLVNEREPAYFTKGCLDVFDKRFKYVHFKCVGAT